MPRKRKTGMRNMLRRMTGDANATYRANAIAFAEDRSTLSYEEKNTKRPEARILAKVGIVPFYQLPSGITGTTNSALATYYVPVSITKQAVLVGNIAEPKDARSIWERAGVEFGSANIEGERIAGFYPAVVRLSAVGKTSTGTEYIDATKTSHITGRQYKLAKKRSGTIPMGRNLKSVQDPPPGGTEPVLIALITEADFGEVKNSIEDLIAKNNQTLTTQVLSASYEPEIVRESIKIPSGSFNPDAIGTLASL